MTMILTDLKEIKAELNIPDGDTSQDKKLLLFAEAASDMIEEYLGHKLRKAERTEYYSGSNTKSLLLKSRPVFTSPTIEVHVSSSGYWGTASGAFPASTILTYGEDFGLEVDQDDGTSRRGILFKINGWWERPYVRSAGLLSPYYDNAHGNIKVVYTAGYSVDKLPAAIRLACNILVARLKYMMPLGFILNSESYEERSISLALPQKNLLMDQVVKPILFSYRNWKF